MDQRTRFHIEQAIERLPVVRRELIRLGNINLAEIVEAATKHLRDAILEAQAKATPTPALAMAAVDKAPEPPEKPPKADRTIPPRSKFGDV